MENYNNLIDPNIEYSNIVYGGANTAQQLHTITEIQQEQTETQQNPDLLLPPQQQTVQDHPQQPTIVDGDSAVAGDNGELKTTGSNIDDLNRQTIIQTSTNNDQSLYHHHNEIETTATAAATTTSTVNPPHTENHNTNYEEAAVAADSNSTSVEKTDHLNNNNSNDDGDHDDDDDDNKKSSEEDDHQLNEMTGEHETKVPAPAAAEPTTKTKTSTAAAATPKATHKANNTQQATETNNNTKKDEEVDPDQCRVCLSKNDLIDIFLVEEANLRFSDKIIVICPNVRIIKNDYLPHFICTTCLQNLKVAYEFKKLCEDTDKELRKKLKRSKNKLRRPTEFILIDCDDFSESNSDDNKNPDDDEFHLSGSLSEADTSGSDYSTEKKRRRTPRRRATVASGRSNRSSSKRTSSTTSSKRKRPSRNSGGGGGANSNAGDAKSRDGGTSPLAENTKRARREIVLIKATEDSDDEDDDLPLKQRSTKPATPASKSKPPAKTVTPKPDAKPNICPYCDKTFPSQSQLREHKKVHSQDTPYICGNCTKEFKQKSNFTAHIMKHKDLSTGKMSCEKPKPKQPRTSGGGSGGGGANTGAGGGGSSSAQKSSGGGGGGGVASGGDKKKKSEFEMTNFGRDLFKCVAPLTTTYWSDSFSD